MFPKALGTEPSHAKAAQLYGYICYFLLPSTISESA